MSASTTHATRIAELSLAGRDPREIGRIIRQETGADFTGRQIAAALLHAYLTRPFDPPSA